MRHVERVGHVGEHVVDAAFDADVGLKGAHRNIARGVADALRRAVSA